MDDNVRNPKKKSEAKDEVITLIKIELSAVLKTIILEFRVLRQQ